MAMSFKTDFPEYESLAIHIRHAHAERSVYLGYVIADRIIAVSHFIKRIVLGALRRPGRSPATSIR
jgi:hypothetical protein